MPRPSPLSLRRPVLPEWTIKALSDPSQPDLEPFDWTLRRLDPLAQSEASGEATAFVELYEKAGGYMPLLSGESVVVTESAAREVAAIHAMQVRVNAADEPFTMAEVYALMPCMPDAWQRVQLVALVLSKGQLPPAALPLVAAEGPEFMALAERHGCFPKPEPEPVGDDDEGNAPGGTALPPSP